jgi:hypothetical protein
MDTSPTTEDTTIGPRALMTHIEGVWEQEHETDPVRASDLICERLAKDGASAKEIICDHLGIGTFNPDVVLRAIVAEEYARSLSAEDKLIWGAGLKPLTAECLLTSIDCAATADEAADDLQEALAEEDFSVICRAVRETETGLTDATVAAAIMLNRMPVLEEMLSSSKRGGRNPRALVLAALRNCYQECAEQSGAGGGEVEQQPMGDGGTAAAVQTLREQEFDGMESMAIAAYALDAFRDGCKPDEYGWPLGLPIPARNEESYESDGRTYIVLRNVNGILAIVRAGSDPDDLDGYEVLDRKDWSASMVGDGT